MKNNSQIFCVKRLETLDEAAIGQIKPMIAKGLGEGKRRKIRSLVMKKNSTAKEYPSNNHFSNGRWSQSEHELFINNSITIGNDWKKVKNKFYFIYISSLLKFLINYFNLNPYLKSNFF